MDRRGRRDFLQRSLSLASLSLLSGCSRLASQAQLTTKMPQIGYLARQDWPPPRIQGFELVINLTTAQALGLSLPQSILIQAAALVE